MSRIDELLSRLCPEGVAFKTLGELGELVRGNGMPKTDFTDSGVGAIHYGQIYTYYGTWTTRTLSHVAPDTAARLAKVDPGDVIITNTSENLEDVGKAVAWLGSDQIVTGGHATIFKHHQDPKFIAYWLQSPSFQSQKKKLASGTKVIDVSAKQLAEVRVPVPPLEVQREIVRILDTFSELEAELEVELEARRAQYAYYRDSLVASVYTGEVARARLGDVATVKVGQAPNEASFADDGPYFFVNAGTTPSGRISETNTPGETVTIPSRGQGGVGVVGFQQREFWCGPLCYRIRSGTGQLSTRFLYYFLKTIQPAIRGLQQTGGTPALNRKELVRVEVPLPPLNEQDRVVRALENFDVLINDLSVGLPAELKARRQQYEYYRDKLLTFKELPGD